jgi:hypothetical protein
MFFSRSVSATVALFVTALPAIAMDADVVPLTFQDVGQVIFARSTWCQNQGTEREQKMTHSMPLCPLNDSLATDNSP